MLPIYSQRTRKTDKHTWKFSPNDVDELQNLFQSLPIDH